MCSQAKANGLQVFGGAPDFREEDCERWLGRVGMLPGCDVGGDDDSDDDGRECSAACAQCGRTYPHEHVRAVRSAATRAADDESSDDDAA